MTREQDVKELVRALSAQAVKEKKLIQFGFTAFRKMCIPADASAAQLADMRMAYMAGAQHLFGSIFQLMTSDPDPTEADMDVMSAIGEEMDAFTQEIKLRTATPGGTS
jgi:hypothetical protein